MRLISVRRSSSLPSRAPRMRAWKGARLPTLMIRSRSVLLLAISDGALAAFPHPLEWIVGALTVGGSHHFSGSSSTRVPSATAQAAKTGRLPVALLAFGGE